MKKIVKKISMVTIAIGLLGISINMFLGPHHIAAGGVSGIGILVEEVFSVDRSVTVLILNLLMLLLAYIFLGKLIFANMIIGSLLLPISLALVPEIMLTQDRLLSVVVGSAIFAVGVAILYRVEASSGGTTIPPLILKKYFNISTSYGLLITDATIVLFNIFVFGFEEFIYAIFSITITSMVMNNIEVGLKRKKAVLIMSEDNIDEIKEVLLETVNRGITVFSVSGGYTGREKNMLMMILSNQEYPRVIRLVNEIDENTFMIAYNVSEVHGLGFTYQPIQ